MSKELELECNIVGGEKKYNMYINKKGYGIPKELYEYLQALTPPTADEVCKALSEWFGYKIKKTQDWNDFYYDWNLNGENGTTTIVGDNSGKVKFYNTILPPHLITLIGRFYEGAMSNEKA